MSDDILHPVVDAFMEIGVFLAAILVLIGWSKRRWKLDSVMRATRHFGPVYAAAMSLPPGCIGVIACVSLYGRGSISFGAVTAALLSTMGDSAWVLLAFDFKIAILLKLLFFVLGALVGTVIDLLKLDPRAKLAAGRTWSQSSVASTNVAVPSRVDNEYLVAADIRTKAEDTVWSRIKACCGSVAPQTSPKLRRTPALSTVVFWAAVFAGMLLKVPVEVGLVDEDLYEEVFGVLNPYVLTGLVGSVSAVLIAVRARGQRLECCNEDGDSSDWLSRTSIEASRIIVMVLTAYGIWALLTEVVGFDTASLPLYGITGILIAALVGLFPSCGLEVVMASLFVAGGLPLPALVTYLLSHDGAGLIPLFAMHRRSAFTATAITTVVAVAIGVSISAIA